LLILDGAFAGGLARSLKGSEGAEGLFEARMDDGLRAPVEGTCGEGGASTFARATSST
jgi:hypothetical protein